MPKPISTTTGQPRFDLRLLVRQLVKVELQTEFRRSYLGLAWMVIVPLVAVFVWIVMNHAGVLDPGNTGVPYPAYVLLSTSIWGFFAEAYRGLSRIIAAHGRVLLSNPLPAAALPARAIVVHLIRFLIPLLLNLVVLLLFGVRFGWAALLFPLALLPLLCAGCALGLFIAPLRLVAADVGRLTDEGIRLLMYLTPIVYAPDVGGGILEDIVAWNPLTYLVGFPRDLLTRGTFYAPVPYLICSILSLLACYLSFRLYRATEVRVRERLIAN